MSRTYRLKREKSNVSAKFVDGQCTVHNAIVDTKLSYLIVHVIFTYPCKFLGEPVVKYKTKKDYWDYVETEQVDHTKCMQPAINTNRGWGWRTGNSMTHMMEMLDKSPRYAVANMHMHEYVRYSKRYRKGEQFFRRNQRKSARRTDHMHLDKILKSGEYDVAQSTVCYHRYG